MVVAVHGVNCAMLSAHDGTCPAQPEGCPDGLGGLWLLNVERHVQHLNSARGFDGDAVRGPVGAVDEESVILRGVLAAGVRAEDGQPEFGYRDLHIKAQGECRDDIGLALEAGQ